MKITQTLKDIYEKATLQYYTIDAQRKRNGEALDRAEQAKLAEAGKQSTPRDQAKPGIS